MKDAIDGFGNLLAGGDPESSLGRIASPGSATVAAHVGLNHAAESRSAVNFVRSALREEGHKVSANTISKGGKFLGKAALALHVGLAANEGREAYNACTED